MAPRAIADISVHLFKIAARFTSRDEARPYLHGVRVQRHPKGGVLLVGTDGHRMFVAHDESGFTKRPITIRTKEGLARARGKTLTATMEQRWKVFDSNGAGTKALPLVKEDFPDWAAVVDSVRRSRGGSPCTVNPIYLRDFTIAARELSENEGHQSLRLIPGKSNHDPLLICFAGFDEAFGVLMPMLDDPKQVGLPLFMKPVLTKIAVKTRAKAQTVVRHGR